jgi:hypothetical protein
VRTRIKDNVVTILSSDDDEPEPQAASKAKAKAKAKAPLRRAQRQSATNPSSRDEGDGGDAPHIEQGLGLEGRGSLPLTTPARKKGKDRREPSSRNHKKAGSASAQRESPNTPAPLPPSTSTEPADNSPSDPFAGDVNLADSHDDDKDLEVQASIHRSYDNILDVSAENNHENIPIVPDPPDEHSDILPDVPVVPLAEHAHDGYHEDEELQEAIYRSLVMNEGGGDDDAIPSSLSTNQEPKGASKPDISPAPAGISAELVIAPATVSVPISGANTDRSMENTLSNALPEEYFINASSSTPVRKTTPLFLPVLDDEDKDTEMQDALYASFSLRSLSDPSVDTPLAYASIDAPLSDALSPQTDPSEPHTEPVSSAGPSTRVTPSYSIAPSLSADVNGETGETDRDDIALQTMIYESLNRAEGSGEFESEPMEMSTPREYLTPPKDNQVDEVPVVSGSDSVAGPTRNEVMDATAEPLPATTRQEDGQEGELTVPLVNGGLECENEEPVVVPEDASVGPVPSAPNAGGEGEDANSGLQEALFNSFISSEGIDSLQDQPEDVTPTGQTNPQAVVPPSPNGAEIKTPEPPSRMSFSPQLSLDEAYAEELARCRSQFLLNRAFSKVDHNITYPSDPSTLLPRLRLHTPRFFSQSCVVPKQTREREGSMGGPSELKTTVESRPLTPVQPASYEIEMKTMESPPSLDQPMEEVDAPTADAVVDENVPTSSPPQMLTQHEPPVLEDAPALVSSDQLIISEVADEVVMEVTSEFLENDPKLAAVFLESKMFMEILRNVQQANETNTSVEAHATTSEEPALPEAGPLHAPVDTPHPQTQPAFSPQQIVESSLSLTPVQIHPVENESAPSPSSLNSSNTLQDSPSPPTPKGQEPSAPDADIFFIRSESPTEFNPHVFAAIMDMASPLPLDKEEDDYFSTHFFDYPDDIAAS